MSNQQPDHLQAALVSRLLWTHALQQAPAAPAHSPPPAWWRRQPTGRTPRPGLRRKETGMLLGTFEATISPAGRVVLPAAFRGALAGGIVMRGFEPCLHLLTPAGWHALAQRVGRVAGGASKQEERRLQQFALAGAAQVVPDSEGSLVISPDLRRYAGLDGSVVFAGLYSYVELWSRERWQEVLHTLDQQAGPLAQTYGAIVAELRGEG